MIEYIDIYDRLNKIYPLRRRISEQGILFESNYAFELQNILHISAEDAAHIIANAYFSCPYSEYIVEPEVDVRHMVVFRPSDKWYNETATAISYMRCDYDILPVIAGINKECYEDIFFSAAYAMCRLDKFVTHIDGDTAIKNYFPVEWCASSVYADSSFVLLRLICDRIHSDYCTGQTYDERLSRICTYAIAKYLEKITQTRIINEPACT